MDNLNLNPLVSVVMATSENHSEWVELSIKSILEQTFKDFEFIIINDSPSNKDFADKLKKYINNDHRVKYFANKNNIGFPLSINKAIEKSKGEYILRMDSDDISYLNRIQNQIDYMKRNQNISISGMQADIINEKGKIIGSIQKPLTEFFIKRYLFHQTPLIHPTFIVKRFVYDFLKCYRDFSPGQDYDFLARAYFNKIRIGNSGEKGIQFRYVKSSLSGNSERSYSKFLITSNIRKMLNEGKVFDKYKLIKSSKKERKNFQNIYRLRLKYIVKSKEYSGFNKIISILLICFFSSLNILLLKDLFHIILAKFYLKFEKYIFNN